RPREHRAGRVDHTLRQPVMVSDVDEHQIAVVALAVNPPRDPGNLAHMARAQLPAGMRPVRMHAAQVYLGSPCLPPNHKTSSANLPSGPCRGAPQLIPPRIPPFRVSSVSPAIPAHAAPRRLARSSSLGSLRVPKPTSTGTPAWRARRAAGSRR